MATLSLPQLSLNLPSTRMSVNFATFASDNNVTSSNTRRAYQGNAVSRKPLPLRTQRSQDIVHEQRAPILESIEEVDLSNTRALRRQNRIWQWRNKSTEILPQESSEGPSKLSRSNSNVSNGSSASTGVSSVFSVARSTTSNTSYATSSPPSRSLTPVCEDGTSLLSLPLSVLEHIVSYTLDLPRTVIIAPDWTEHRHLHHRYNRPSREQVDLRQFSSQSIFTVSKDIRAVALEVFYRTCEVAIDISSIYYTRVASTVSDNVRMQTTFWNSPPRSVRDALSQAGRVQLRLPVPSTEAGQHRGRGEDDWMDGSDGQGGGNWKIKSMKKEQEDALAILGCLESIVSLLKTDPRPIKDLPRPSRSFNLRRAASFRSRSKSRSGSQSRSQSRSSSRVDVYDQEGDGTRQPLKRLEVCLVKRSSHVLVLPETLNLIRVVRSLPVKLHTRYHFELHGQRMTWATKYRQRWQGKEPDGSRLLQDLQSLTVAAPPVEPICTPTEFKFVDVKRGHRLELIDTAMPKTPITLEGKTAKRPTSPKTSKAKIAARPSTPRFQENKSTPRPVTPKETKKKPAIMGLFTKSTKDRRHDSFELVADQGLQTEPPRSSGKKSKKKQEPPTLEELKQIADDIRNGVY